MFTPSVEVEAVLAPFATLFTRPNWRRAQALLCGGLLAPTNCVITAALRVLGLSDDAHFQNYHRVLNRARWSAHHAAGILLRLPKEIMIPQEDFLIITSFRTVVITMILLMVPVLLHLKRPGRTLRLQDTAKFVCPLGPKKPHPLSSIKLTIQPNRNGV